VLSDCAKPVIEIASNNVASNPKPKLFAIKLLVLLLIFDPSFAKGREAADAFRYLWIHGCRVPDNQKIESLAVEQQMKIAEIFRTDFDGKVFRPSSSLANSFGLARMQGRLCLDGPVSLAAGIIRMANPCVKVRLASRNDLS
jgi:hypothetical protein